MVAYGLETYYHYFGEVLEKPWESEISVFAAYGNDASNEYG